MTKIAKMVGVSQATVSRVINNQPGVAESTICEVREAIGRVGYKPHTQRKRGGMVDVKTIGLVYSMNGGVLHSQLALESFDGVVEAAGRNGVNLLVYHATSDGAIQGARRGEVQGVVVMAELTTEQVMESFGDVPIVWLSSRRGDEHVLEGNGAIGKLAADYLQGKGCQHLAFFNTNPSFAVYEARCWAFEMAARQGEATVSVLRHGDNSKDFRSQFDRDVQIANLKSAVDELLSLEQRPSGAFVPDDYVTALLYPILIDKGILPGKDLKIISCCNERAYLEGLVPKPATIDIGLQSGGRYAVEQLFWKIKNDDEREMQLVISPVLVEPE